MATEQAPQHHHWQERSRYRVGPVLAAVCLGVLLLAAVVSLWPGDFSPGEELISPGAKDIAVSQEDKVYPTSDRLRFDGGPRWFTSI